MEDVLSKMLRTAPHGAANNVFVIGKNLKKGGFYNELASLNDLDEKW